MVAKRYCSLLRDEDRSSRRPQRLPVGGGPVQEAAEGEGQVWRQGLDHHGLVSLPEGLPCPGRASEVVALLKYKSHINVSFLVLFPCTVGGVQHAFVLQRVDRSCQDLG